MSSDHRANTLRFFFNASFSFIKFYLKTIHVYFCSNLSNFCKNKVSIMVQYFLLFSKTSRGKCAFIKIIFTKISTT